MSDDISGLEGNISSKLRFPKEIYTYPLYINIKLRPCPIGFALFHSKCACADLLRRKVAPVTCDVQSGTISRDGSYWVGMYDNDTVAVSQYCPLNYCKNDSVQLTLSRNAADGIDTQCNYRHSGVLCGGCRPDMSVALGTEQCLQCSNAYIALVLPFALAGGFVVFIIKALDLMVCHGAINGIIFYANVVSANKHLFYHNTATNPLTLFIAWFNLDLGIQTCFYDGLTAYVRTWLQFVFPVYIWSVAGGIIILAKNSKRVALLSGNNGVPVLNTLFLLSYAKLLNTIISALSYTTIYTTKGPRLV